MSFTFLGSLALLDPSVWNNRLNQKVYIRKRNQNKHKGWELGGYVLSHFMAQMEFINEKTNNQVRFWRNIAITEGYSMTTRFNSVNFRHFLERNQLLKNSNLDSEVGIHENFPNENSLDWTFCQASILVPRNSCQHWFSKKSCFSSLTLVRDNSAVCFPELFAFLRTNVFSLTSCNLGISISLWAFTLSNPNQKSFFGTNFRILGTTAVLASVSSLESLLCGLIAAKTFGGFQLKGEKLQKSKHFLVYRKLSDFYTIGVCVFSLGKILSVFSKVSSRSFFEQIPAFLLVFVGSNLALSVCLKIFGHQSFFQGFSIKNPKLIINIQTVSLEILVLVQNTSVWTKMVSTVALSLVFVINNTKIIKDTE
jgi:hypothetical protein